MLTFKKTVAKILMALLIAPLAVWSGCSPKQIEIQSSGASQKVDLSRVPDGTLLGSHVQDSVEFKVEVTVVQRQITRIDILDADGRVLNKKCARCSAEVLIAEIIQEQTLEVDAISGATTTTQSILQAVKNALSLQ